MENKIFKSLLSIILSFIFGYWLGLMKNIPTSLILIIVFIILLWSPWLPTKKKRKINIKNSLVSSFVLIISYIIGSSGWLPTDPMMILYVWIIIMVAFGGVLLYNIKNKQYNQTITELGYIFGGVFIAIAALSLIGFGKDLINSSLTEPWLIFSTSFFATFFGIGITLIYVSYKSSRQ